MEDGHLPVLVEEVNVIHHAIRAEYAGGKGTGPAAGAH